MDDLAYAFEQAASFLEMEEWPEPDGGRQVAAYREAAKRVSRQAAHYRRKARAIEDEQLRKEQRNKTAQVPRRN